MQHHIDQFTRSSENTYVDAQDIALKLFGNHILANVLLLGVAYQAGYIPLQAESIEDAIRLNGQAVDMNLQAFRWGRMLVYDRSRLDEVLEIPVENSDQLIIRYSNLLGRGRSRNYRNLIDRIPIQRESFKRLWVSRIGELMAFMDARYAERFVERIEEVYHLDAQHGGANNGFSITKNAAFMLHKLMAYKDEYEVARLLTDPSDVDIAGRFDGKVSLSYHLHPPLLKAWGLDRKVRLGPWFRPFLLILARCKFLRFTPLDPFGYTACRREERALIQWYESPLEQALARLSAINYDEIAELLNMPDGIRGYEEVKLRSMRRVMKQAEKKLAEIPREEANPHSACAGAS